MEIVRFLTLYTPAIALENPSHEDIRFNISQQVIGISKLVLYDVGKG